MTKCTQKKDLERLTSYPKSILKVKEKGRPYFENPSLIVFGVKWFNCDVKKSYLRTNPAWNKDDILSRHLILMFIGTSCIN